MTAEPKAGVGEETMTRGESLPLAGELMAVLERTSLESGYQPDRDRQEGVLKNLPSNLVEQLRGHWRAAYQEFEFFKEKRGEPNKEFDDRAVILGELFEMLVEGDGTLNQRSKISEEFLSLMHDPARFGFEKELGGHRNPDLATFRHGGFVIDSIGEAKLGLLGFRAYRQLREGGFLRGVRAAANLINSRSDLEELGLTNLGSVVGEGHQLTLAGDFHQVLVVPANRNTGKVDSLINSKEFSRPYDYDRFAVMLESSQKIEIKKAAFSVVDVNALVDYLLPRVLEGETSAEVKR